jgi:hypothetical protein
LDDIQERIQENEDLVQSTDVVSFQKLWENLSTGKKKFFSKKVKLFFLW